MSAFSISVYSFGSNIAVSASKVEESHDIGFVRLLIAWLLDVQCFAKGTLPASASGTQ